MNLDQRKEMVGSLTWGLSIVVLALACSAARKWGYLDSETVTRLVIGTTGLMIAWMGNRMPKAFVPTACARQARRIAGWSMTLSGLVYAGMFAFAPLQVAAWGGVTAIVAGMAVTGGYCWSLRQRASR